MWQSIFGWINSGCVLFSIYGIWLQLNTIRKRQQHRLESTSQLSLNQFSVSYFAYWSFFVFGLSLNEINYFLVIPRLTAALLVCMIVWHIHQDRKNTYTKLCINSMFVSLLFGVGACYARYMDAWYTVITHAHTISSGLIVLISLLIAQGYAHQVYLVIRRQSVGAIDKRMSQFILLMDCSTITLALSMQGSLGWPLLTLAITSALTKIVLLVSLSYVEGSKQ